MGWVDTWEGGRVWRDKKGRKVYVIRRSINGKRYAISTRCHKERAALEHLARFEADPEGYDPTASLGEAIVLNDKLIDDFCTWSELTKGNSPGWVAKKRTFATWWKEQLRGRDLRRVDLGEHVAPALAPKKLTSRTHRIEVLKAIYAWLRTERHVLTAAEDPTYGALRVPQGRPEQWKTPKVIPREDYEKVLEHLAPFYRHCLMVLGGTGWHTTELYRFAVAGVVAELPSTASKDHGAAAVLICPKRKSGEAQRTPVTEEVAHAAGWVRAHGGFSDPKFRAAIASACAAAKVEPFTPGRFRHSVATWAIEKGADPAAVAAFLGHKSPATTKRFYATLAVVPKVPTLK